MADSNIHPARQQCPHLGLLDDPTTALAYPSEWNVCYRAQPSSPVHISHQREACLDRRFADCIVFQNALTGAMPSELRGRPTVRARRGTSWRVAILVIAVLILIILLWPRFF